MAFSFKCPACAKTLKVPQEYVGRRANCPGCKNSITITAPTDVAAAPTSTTSPKQQQPSTPKVKPSAQVESGNFYSAPQTPLENYSASPAEHATRSVNMELRTGEVLDTAWSIFKENWYVALLSLVAAAVMHLIAQIIFAFPFVILNSFLKIFPIQEGSEIIAATIFVFAIVVLVGLNGWIYAGTLKIALKACRGEKAVFKDIFSGLSGGVNFSVTYFMICCLIIGSTALLVLPGLYMTLMLFPALFVVADRNTSFARTLKECAAMTKGRKLFILGVIVSTAGIMLVTSVVVLGLILSPPYALIVLTVTYLRLSGQPVVVQSKQK